MWRKLKRLGVAQVGDGLVALPADPRTQEHLEWVAEEITEAGGSSTLWRAELNSRAQERLLVASLQEARAAEYNALIFRLADLPAPTRQESLRTLRSVRRELREIQRRDYFPPPQRQQARAAVKAFGERALSVAQAKGVEL